MDIEDLLPRKSKILLYDIETLPNIVAAWGLREQNALWVHQAGCMASFAWRWYGVNKTYVKALPDYPIYSKQPFNDYYLVSDLHELFEEADIIIAHNGDSFDQKISNGRFLIHDYPDPSSYRSVDTLKVARRRFKLSSNRLDAVAEQLGVGNKLKTGGIDLWRECYYGSSKAWKKMKTYNKHDVLILEGVYQKLLPWINNHPNRALIENRPDVCPKCGSDEGFVSNGWHHTNVSRYKRLRCVSCKGNVQGKQNMGVKTKYK